MTAMCEEVLPCPICGKPVEKDDWYILATQAEETLRTGSRIVGFPQKPLHLSCVVRQLPKEDP